MAKSPCLKAPLPPPCNTGDRRLAAPLLLCKQGIASRRSHILCTSHVRCTAATDPPESKIVQIFPVHSTHPSPSWASTHSRPPPLPAAPDGYEGRRAGALHDGCLFWTFHPDRAARHTHLLGGVGAAQALYEGGLLGLMCFASFGLGIVRIWRNGIEVSDFARNPHGWTKSFPDLDFFL